MNSKQLYINKKEELLNILEDETLSASQKLEKSNFLEIITILEIYQTELSAQNQELIEKEQQLLNLKDEFEELYNFAPIAYLKLDEDFKILKYNQMGFNILAKNNRSLKISNQLNLYIANEGMRNYIQFISNAKEFGKSEAVLQFHNNNEIMYGKVSISSYAKEQKSFYLLSIIDVTKEMEQEAIILIQSKNAAMGEMLSMITHQWKQPLSVLFTLSSWMEMILESDEFDKERFVNYLKSIGEQIEYMNDTIEDFKNFFSKNRDKIKINIQDCIDRAIKFTAPSLKKYEIELEVSYENRKEYMIVAYNHDVCQVLMNIINNAKDELKKKNIIRKIQLDIYAEKNNIVFAIKNNGGVIPDEIIDIIFNQNFTTKSEENGSGIGLYIVQKIVNEHLNGEISVENIPNEDSVVFYLKIPLLEREG